MNYFFRLHLLLKFESYGHQLITSMLKKNHIPRSNTMEIQRLLAWFPAVCMVGARQVGKTTLARSLAAMEGQAAVYLDLEAERDRRKLKDPYLFFKRYENQCVVLDEVQRMPGLFEQLRGIIDENRRPGRFLLLGSAAPALLQQSSESLAGRIAYLELPPFNRLEIEAHFDLETHWLRGGFPDALLVESDEQSEVWRQNFIRTYLERDLRMLGLSGDINQIRRFWQMIAAVNGGIWNAEAFGASLGVTGATLKKQLDFLENAYLLTVLPAWSHKTAKRLVKAPKVYVRDSGILHAILRLDRFDELMGHPILGVSWEGYVIEQIRQNCKDQLEMYFYRTHHGAECDLVLAKGNQPLACVEIKFSSAPDVSRGFYQVVEDLGTAKNFIVVPHTDDYPFKENIEVTNLDTFLRVHLPQLM
jgi:uncharacterized protein